MLDSNNLLVIFEETGGNPLKITLKTHYTKTVCAKVSENDYPPLDSWWHPNIVSGKKTVSDVPPEIHLQCDDGHVISGIKFASFGNPSGSCQKFSVGHCHASSSSSVVQTVNFKFLFIPGFYLFVIILDAFICIFCQVFNTCYFNYGSIFQTNFMKRYLCPSYPTYKL